MANHLTYWDQIGLQQAIRSNDPGRIDRAWEENQRHIEPWEGGSGC